MTRADVVATGLSVPEGPVAHPDGRVSFTEQTCGRVSVWEAGEVSVVAVTGGGPNSHTAGSDGCLYVAQNGGVVDAWRSPDPRPPGIQRIRPDGTVETVTTTVAGQPLLAPNDLVFGPDGCLYLTDPGHPFNPERRGAGGRLGCFGPSNAAPVGRLVIDVGPVYCNGLAFDAEGRLVWVESYDRHICRLDEGGGRVQIGRLPEGHTPDGLAVATDGRLFIATGGSHGITVVAPYGQVLDLLVLDDTASPSNCAFDDAGGLWVTDFGVDWATREGAGRLWRVATDARGLPVATGSLGPPA